jgi:GT2 family glycosyltransferase
MVAAVVHIGIVLYKNKKSQIERVLKSVNKNIKHLKSLGKDVKILVKFYQNDSVKYGDFGIKNIRGNGRNLGFGTAHNIMMEESFDSDCDFYLCLNPDAVLKYDAIYEMLDAYFQYGGGCLIEARQFPIEHPKCYDQVSFDVPWVSGFCFLMSKEIYDKVLGFDENMFLYCEDVDLSWRVKASGFGLKMAPKSVAFHEVITRGDKPRNQTIQMHYAGEYLGIKWGDTNFANYCKEVLKDMGIKSTDKLIPKYEYDEKLLSPEFNHGFSFSEVRF